MKKTVRILALVMALATVLCVFAACGTTLSGTYSNVEEVLGIESGARIEFSGKKFEMTLIVLGQEATLEGTYKIKDDKITFTFDEDEIENDWVKEAVEDMTDSVDFKKGDDYIKIGGVKYEKE